MKYTSRVSRDDILSSSIGRGLEAGHGLSHRHQRRLRKAFQKHFRVLIIVLDCLFSPATLLLPTLSLLH